MLSRKAASRTKDSATLMHELKAKDIVVMARSKRTLTEESPEAYKDIDAVADVVAESGIGLKVARIRPVGVIKG